MAQDHVFPEVSGCTGGLAQIAGALCTMGHLRVGQYPDVVIAVSHSLDAPDSIPGGSMYVSKRDGQTYQTFTYR